MAGLNNIIKKTAEILSEGGIILYPTDTVWGLGCDASNSEAVKKIYSIKKSNEKSGMLVLLDSYSKLSFYVREVPEIAWELTEVSDKPLTLIYPGARNVAKELLAEDGSLGIRIVDDDFCTGLISRFRKPVVSTSANISGEGSPGTFSEISDEIKEAVDYIVPLHQDDIYKKTASSIIKIEVDGQFKIIR